MNVAKNGSCWSISSLRDLFSKKDMLFGVLWQESTSLFQCGVTQAGSTCKHIASRLTGTHLMLVYGISPALMSPLILPWGWERWLQHKPAVHPVLGAGRITALHYKECSCPILLGKGVLCFDLLKEKHCSERISGGGPTARGGGWCHLWVLTNHSGAGNDQPPVQPSSSPCSHSGCSVRAAHSPLQEIAQLIKFCVWGFSQV